MPGQSAAKLAKQERVIEAVRQGLEGEASVEFIQQSGYAMTNAGIARHLRNLGGRGRVHELVEQGLSNAEIVEACLPSADPADAHEKPHVQGELFHGTRDIIRKPPPDDSPLYATTKLSIRIPSDLYAAIRAAAQGERKTQTQLIVELLTSALSRMPRHVQEEMEEIEKAGEA